MNIENILKTADAIEQGSIPDLGFNMSIFLFKADEWRPDYSSRNCGTVACLAGWADAVRGERMPTLWSGLVDRAIRFLGLSHDEASALFLPRGCSDNPERFTPKAAVECLRHLARTGQVDWERAIALTSEGGAA